MRYSYRGSDLREKERQKETDRGENARVGTIKRGVELLLY